MEVAPSLDPSLGPSLGPSMASTMLVRLIDVLLLERIVTMTIRKTLASSGFTLRQARVTARVAACVGGTI